MPSPPSRPRAALLQALNHLILVLGQHFGNHLHAAQHERDSLGHRLAISAQQGHADARCTQLIHQLLRIVAQLVCQCQHGHMRIAQRAVYATHRLRFQPMRLCLKLDIQHDTVAGQPFGTASNTVLPSTPACTPARLWLENTARHIAIIQLLRFCFGDVALATLCSL